MEEIFNGSHRKRITNNYFEWWYFHFIDNNGKGLNLIIHETDLFGLKSQPYASISVLVKKGFPEHFHTKLDPNEILPDSKYIRLRNNEVFETKNSIKINMNFEEGEVKFSVTIQKKSKPLVIKKGILFENKKRKSFWVVQIPYAIFSGSLKIGKVTHKLNGKVYQDHQWGNLPVQNFVYDWIWGVFYDHKQSNIFFRIKTHDSKLIDRAAITSANKQVKDIKFRTSFLKKLVKMGKPQEIKLRSELITMNRHKICFSLQPNLLMRKRVKEKLPGFNATYLRWFLKNRTSSGIVEYLKIRNGQF